MTVLEVEDEVELAVAADVAEIGAVSAGDGGCAGEGAVVAHEGVGEIDVVASRTAVAADVDVGVAVAVEIADLTKPLVLTVV